MSNFNTQHFSYLSFKEAGAVSGYTHDYIGKLCRDGSLECRRMGRAWFVEEGSLNAFIVNQEHQKALLKNRLKNERKAEYADQERAFEEVLPEPVTTPSDEKARVQKGVQEIPTVLPVVVEAQPEESLLFESYRGEEIFNTYKSDVPATRPVQSVYAPSTLHTIVAQRSTLKAASVPAAHVARFLPVLIDVSQRAVALLLTVAIVFSGYALTHADVLTALGENAEMALSTVLDMSHQLPERIAYESTRIDDFVYESDTFARLAITQPALVFSGAHGVLGRLSIALGESVHSAALWWSAIPVSKDMFTFEGSRSGEVRVLVREVPVQKRTVAQKTEVQERVSPSAVESRVSTIINNPVVERIVERVIERPVVAQQTFTPIEINQKLEILENELRKEIFRMSSANDTRPVDNFRMIALSQKIDQLNGTDISNATITGGSITGSAITASSFSTSGTLTFLGLGTGSGSEDVLVVGADGVVKKLSIASVGRTEFSALDDTDIVTPLLGQIAIYDGVDSWDNKTISGDATLASDGTLSIAAGVIGNDELAFDTGQALTTTSSPAFAGLSLNGFSGFLKATAGTIATALIDLTSDVTGILPDANVSDTLTIGTGSTVADGALSTNVSLLGQTITGSEIVDDSVDISDDTNLVGDSEIVLTNDTLSIGSSIARDSELHDAVTLAGTLDYITIVGQTITRNAIDLATDVTGILGITFGGTGSSTASGARTNLGLEIGTNVQAYNANTSLLGQTIESAEITDGTISASDLGTDSVGADEISANSVTLTTDTVGNYVATGASGNGVSLTGGGSEGATLTAALGALTANWNQTGAFDISLNNASSELSILESTGATYFGTLDVGDLSANATYTLSGATGTIWTSGNDGAGSTLDADTLDGISSASFLQATSIDTSSELAAILTDETGSGALVFGTSPSLTTPTIAGATLSGTISGGTFTSGTWNGTAIGDAYLTKTGDWTGTLDGYEGATLNQNIANTDLTLTSNRTLTLGANTFNIAGSTTGDFSVNTDDLFVDTSTGNVGIGTTTPETSFVVNKTSGTGYLANIRSAVDGTQGGFALHQLNTSYTNPFSVNSGDGFTTGDPVHADFVGGILPWSASGGVALIGNSNATGVPGLAFEANQGVGGTTRAALWLNAVTSDGLGNKQSLASGVNVFQVANNGSQLLTVQGGGNVGIGATSPAFKLDVNGTARFGNSTNGVDFGSAAMRFVGSAPLIYTSGYGAPLKINASAIYLNDASGGNVGIGTTAPGELLDVRGNSGANKGVLVKNDGAGRAILRLDSGGTSTTNMFFALGGVDKWSLQAHDSYNFAIIDNTVAAHRFLVDASGNVGIGTTSPLSKLSVSGGASVGADYNIAAPTNGLIVQGNVGIGTTGPNAPLSFGSNVNALKLFLYENGNTRYGLGVASGELRTYAPSGSNVMTWGALSTSDGTTFAEKMRLDLNTGNVGIGTTNPGGLLTLQKNNEGIRLETTSDPTNYYAEVINRYDASEPFYVKSLSVKILGRKSIVTSQDTYLAGYNGLSFLTATTNNPTLAYVRMHINSAGNVGIGDTTPASLLTVGNGDLFQVNSSGAIAASTGITTSGQLNLSGTSANIALGSNYLSGDGGDEGVYVDSTGNVGIGTTTPASKFNLYNAGSATTIAGRNINLGAVVTPLSQRSGFTVWNNSNSYLAADHNAAFGFVHPWDATDALGTFKVFRITTGTESGAANTAATSMTDRFYVQKDGGAYFQNNVGFGDTSPAALLTVGNGDLFQVNSSGAIAASTGITTTGQVTLSGSAANIALGSNYLSGDGGDEGIYVDSTGNVGAGTAAPSSKLDITTAGLGTTQTTSSGLALVNTTSASAGAQQISPAIRWSGFGWKTDATAASQAVDFRAFVTPVEGAASPTGYLGFGSSINGGAYSDGQLVLASTGYVGINDTTPSVLLDVGDSSVTDGTTLLTLEDSNSVCSYTADNAFGSCASDETLKKNVQNLSGSLERISALRLVTFNWNTDDEGAESQVGFIAQEVAQILPELVTPHEWIDGTTKNFLNTGGMIPHLVGAVQELNVKVDELALNDALFVVNGTNAENEPTFVGAFLARLVTWFANTANGIGAVFAQSFNASEQICIDGECLTADDVRSLKALAAIGATTVQQGGNPSTSPGASTPTITIIGNSPATIAVNDTYSDLGAIAKNTAGTDISYTTKVDGVEVTAVSLDTAIDRTYTIVYFAEEGGVVVSAERTVVVGLGTHTNIDEITEDPLEDQNTDETTTGETE